MNASALSAQEERVRLILSNRMAEIQAKPGPPDQKREKKVETGYGPVTLVEQSAPAGLKTDKEVELSGVTRVTLIANWTRAGVAQSRRLEFYVYRAG